MRCRTRRVWQPWRCSTWTRARDVGVGEKLLDTVIDWSARRGATGVDVHVLPGMRTSKNFLEGSGFVARLLVMHRQLK